MSSREKYVAAAYGVVFVAVLVYVVDHRGEARRGSSARPGARRAGAPARGRIASMAELLFWPALLAYGEAAVAYAGELRGPGSPAGSAPGASGSAGSPRRRCSSRRPRGADGFPWATWAGSLNLFVWLVVGAYLIWGCTPRYRLLGLAVMPLAAALLALAWAGGGTARRTSGALGRRSSRCTSASCSRRFAGLTLAAGLAGALPLAGAAAEAARAPTSCACASRRSRRSTGLAARTRARLARAAHARHRRRARPASSAATSTRAMAVTLAIWARLRGRCSCSGTRAGAAAASRAARPRRLRARRASSSP